MPTSLAPALAPQDPPEDDHESAALIGKRVGNFVISRILGTGGMGAVLVADHPALGKRVAMKFLSPALAAVPEMARRFVEEARVAAGLSHPNIVDIFDFGVLDGRPYYVMELLAGRDLAAVMSARGRFTAEEVTPYLTQMCAALGVAHDRGIIHRDLKPPNVFVGEGSAPTVKLLDFGIAKLMDVQKENARTRTGQVMGTPTHMAPEQVIGAVRDICPQTDLYALGGIVYEMLTGRPVFSHESMMMLMMMHVRDAVVPVRDLAPDVPEGVALLVEACLAKAPAQRPVSAREVVRAYLAALGSSAAEAVARGVSWHPAPPLALAVTQPGPPRSAAAPTVPISRATTSSGVRSVPTKLLPVVVSATDPTVVPGLEEVPPEPAADEPVSTPENEAVEAPAPPPLPHALAELTDVPDLVLTERDQGVLDRLLGKMQRKGDFPAFMKNVTEINVKANITSDVSATQLGELILRDYALTSKLLRVVNSTSYERLGKRVNKVSRAVVVLGFDKVRSTALAISLHKNHGPRAHAPELAELSINALVSGEIARTLARDAGLADSEETQVCAMFRNVGLQLLVHYMPEEFGRAKEAAAEQAISLDQAVTQVVGISARKLGLGVMQRWRMSPRVFWSMQPPSTQTKPRTDDDKLRVLSAFANDLTSVVSTVPEEDLPRALEALLGRYRVGLPMSIEKLNALLGTVQKAFNERYATLLDLDPSKSAFCQKASRITGLLPDGSSPHADADGAHVVARSSADQRLDAIELVLQGEHHPGEVLRSVLEAFALEFGMRRAMLLTLGSDRTSLTVQCAWGEDGRSLEEELVFPLGGMHSGELLANAHHLQRDVVVPDAFDAKVTAKMPRPYYEVLGSKAFVALPCGGKGTPVRVLFADGDTPETLPGPAHAATVARFRELIGRKGLNPSGLLDVLRRPVGRRPMGR